MGKWRWLNFQQEASGILALATWILSECYPNQAGQFLSENGVLNADRLGERYRRRVDPEIGAASITAILGDSKMTRGLCRPRSSTKPFSGILDEVNLPYTRNTTEMSRKFLSKPSTALNMSGLDDNGPKLGPIDLKQSSHRNVFHAVATKFNHGEAQPGRPCPSQ